jgi:hypothetical protein
MFEDASRREFLLWLAGQRSCHRNARLFNPSIHQPGHSNNYRPRRQGKKQRNKWRQFDSGTEQAFHNWPDSVNQRLMDQVEAVTDRSNESEVPLNKLASG